jgi:hypothetical protein
MKSFDEDTHAFIVRIWPEPREIEGAAFEWRGVVEHITTRERRYFRNLDEVTSFISPYVRAMGSAGGSQNCKKSFKPRAPFHKGD